MVHNIYSDILDNTIRQELLDHTSGDRELDEYTYENYYKTITDVTGSLGIWGVTQR